MPHKELIVWTCNECGRLLLSYCEYLDGEYPYLKMCIFDGSDITTETYTVDKDGSSNVDQGYSAYLYTDENELLMVTYITDDATKPYIRGCRITL